MDDNRSTVVVITAKDAADTAAYAVASALYQRHTAEVVVVDDGSSDGTVDVVNGADDGSGRLKIISLGANVGPARARNIAIAASNSPFICILDADDYMAPDRLDRIFTKGGDDWDLLADDLFFTQDYQSGIVLDKLLSQKVQTPGSLTLDAFLAGNISRKDRHRRELGFLKPVMRRSFLANHSLGYDERLRLGEDLILYANALLNGARFRIVEGCGYFAVERPNSLSGAHRTADIAALYRALDELEAAAERRGKDAPAALAPLLRSTRNNRDFRVLLDAKREQGIAAAIAVVANSPASIPYIVREIGEAKWDAALKKLNAVAARFGAPSGNETAPADKTGAKRKPTR